MIPIEADKIKFGSYIAAYVCDANYDECGGARRSFDIFKTGRRNSTYGGDLYRIIPGFAVDYYGSRWDKRGTHFFRDDVECDFSHPSEWRYVKGQDSVRLFLLTEEEIIQHIILDNV